MGDYAVVRPQGPIQYLEVSRKGLEPYTTEWFSPGNGYFLEGKDLVLARVPECLSGRGPRDCIPQLFATIVTASGVDSAKFAEEIPGLPGDGDCDTNPLELRETVQVSQSGRVWSWAATHAKRGPVKR